MINEEDNKEKTDNAKDNAQKSGLKDKLLKILKNAASNYAKDKTGDLLDELFLGNFKDACIKYNRTSLYHNFIFRKFNKVWKSS